MSKPAVRDIVREYLRAHGYNGLRTDDCGRRPVLDSPCGRCYGPDRSPAERGAGRRPQQRSAGLVQPRQRSEART